MRKISNEYSQRQQISMKFQYKKEKLGLNMFMVITAT